MHSCRARSIRQQDTGDTINGFSQADHDQIDLSALGMTGGFLGSVSGGGVIGAHQFGYAQVGSSTVIFIDTDGIVGADLEITLNSLLTLTSGVGGDFVI